MLSRVADSIFWMCRYIERAENVARFIDVNMHLAMDVGTEGVRVADQWAPLVVDHRRQRAVSSNCYRRARAASTVIEFLTFDERQPELDSLLFARAREKRPHGPRDDLVVDVGASQ